MRLNDRKVCNKIKIDGFFIPLLQCALALGSGRAVWSNCRGKRLDTLKLDRFMTPSECVEMGGDCCGVNDDGMGHGQNLLATKHNIQAIFY